MLTPKIIFFDIDDTIYQKSGDILRPSVLQAMLALKQQGILTAISTGRPFAAIPPKVHDVIRQAGIDLIMTTNGQIIRHRGEILDKQPLDKAKIEKMCVFLENRKIPYAFVADHTIAVSESVPLVEDALTGIIPDYPTDKYFYRNHDVFQMLVFYPEHQDIVSSEAAKYGYKTVRWHPNAVDMLDISSSKARGIRHALSLLAIKPEQTMAFGDGLNDIEMMQAVGFGVAMGNGHPELKAAADYICPAVGEDGIFKGLQALKLIA
ncbi:Cof-type HAD-IIB family hydrolase [Neisseria weaveri]|uniref:HAD hydrolase n=1 Tax=Neisseria weaveri TaxID=28091 RepID=A0A3S4ZBH2_9NEIS|nr:Cof-type HAD-IIB family hydrolase [Neisseria weaveri]EGV35341.1 HAD hydrolase, IIB family [Neisseria weaveri LMG 5135]EGV35875.1 HAD hydrolase, IIB family [Neisseria weaveri ATCC 51223]SAY51241.1 HAD hydrolase [Neisseria weaveri]VEJ49961.1 HAD hydrolase [Neisseria weaveri]